jgi:hypothetical protein
MNAPIAVNKLSDGKVNAGGDDGRRFGLCEAVLRHEKLSRLGVRVRHGLINARSAIDVARVISICL